MKNSIGEQEDFLMTILTTATNLEDLIESKPTARGQVLTKFLGLEFLKKKEETGKELYSEFSKGMLSNIYNTETLKQDNVESEEKITELESQIDTANKNISDVTSRLKKGQGYKEGLIASKYTDIDQELVIMNPSNIEIEIQGIVNDNGRLTKEISEVNVVEPSSFYHEDEHDKVKEEYNEKYKVKVQLETKISDIKKLQSSVEGGIQCEHCGINLMNAAITQSKIGELAGYILQKEENEGLMTVLSGKEQSFTQLKKEFDQYEKNKLIKSKLELTLESNDLKKSKLDDKLKRYFDVQEKIKSNNEVEQKLIKANLLIEELEREKRQYENTVTSNGVQIKNLNDKIKKNNEYIIKIGEEFEKERIYKIYSEVFGKNGISKIIMKTMMPLINSELQRLLQDSSYFRLEIRISDKNEVEFWMIDNSTGVEKLMVSGSGYERTIASLALRAVLSKVCSLPKPNIIVFDEVFGKISNDNLEMVSEFFTKIKEYFEKIFVITHNPLVTNWADSIVKINKVENISKVSQ
jgi:DNA repair exonuclease SbcCD ATPase subunit